MIERAGEGGDSGRAHGDVGPTDRLTCKMFEERESGVGTEVGV